MNMKARYILFAAAALVASAACTKTSEQPEPEGFQLTFRAYQEGALDTKTTVQDGGTHVYWEPSDEIKVFFKNSSGRFVSQNDALAAVADFSGTLNILVGANEGASSANQTWGLYPYRADATCDGDYVTTTLPSSQTGRAGSFAKNTHICLARSGGYDLAFYNVTGGLRFSLTQEGINSVTFEGNNGESLAGKIKLTFEGGIPVINEVSEGETTLTLTAPAGGTFQTGTWYYIEAIPATLSKGFKMVFTKGNETAKISSTGSVTISRGKYGSLADADEGLIFKENGGGEGPDPSSVIQFADPIAKYACVEKFDTDGDGEVSYAEAAAVTTLEGLFTDWNTVTSFDEIKYFTGVTSTQNLFNGCGKLKSITIPDFITTLGTFQNCSSLESVILPSRVTSLPPYCFDGCSSLTDVTLPSVITSVPNYCFRGCSALKTVDLPATVISMGQYAFNKCTSLTSAVLPTNMTTIPIGLFADCTSLRTITWPSALQSIGDRAFSGCRFEENNYTLVLPSTVTSIGYNAFGALHHLIVPSTSFVSIENNSFAVCYTFLYVPASLVEIYKVRTNWSNYKNRILPIEDYPSRPQISGTVAEAVDLGLPSGLKWASWNIGSSSPEEYGAYFAWGETEPKWDYDWSTYKFELGTDSSGPFSKYVTQSSYGTVDKKTAIDLEDDVARVKWGGVWRIPTDAEWTELKENCSCTWTDNYNGTGIKGQVVTSSNGNSIFLPAAGCWNGTSFSSPGSSGSYWSSSLNPPYPYLAGNTFFYSGNVNTYSGDERCSGLSIRPVCPKD